MSRRVIEVLEIEGLAVARGERRLFADFDLRLAAGEAVVVTGPNGSGKTSLLRVVAGLLRPLAGAVRFLGPSGPLDKETARAHGLHLVGHLDALKGGRLARSELEFATAWLGGVAADATRAAERLGVASLLSLEVRRLSAGQRRRLALARLVAAPRPLWLLDEPSAPLDTAARAFVGELMVEHLAGGGLILAASHDVLSVAARRVELRE